MLSKLKTALIGALASLAFTTSAQASFDACRDEFPRQTPPAVQGERLRQLCFDSFAVLHSGVSKTPVYVVERLNRARLQEARDETRTDKFYAEARLPSADRATLDDYRGSGFDRGHMAPAADMPNANAMAQSFSLANMVPQAPKNNRGPWAKNVEQATRQYVLRATGDVFVFTGPMHRGQVTSIGPGKVWVPSHLFKLVYDATTNRAWAHVVENTDTARAGRPISYGELVKLTGIEFLPGISPRP